MNDGTDEIFRFADDFGKAASAIGKALFDTFKEEGETFAEDWRRNAEQTSGKHGRHYPKSITSEAKVALGIHIETGPESRRRQGGMGPGFEFGSQNQPPHLDGLRALGPASKRLEKAADEVIERLLP
jgi:hypothetical protein